MYSRLSDKKFCSLRRRRRRSTPPLRFVAAVAARRSLPLRRRRHRSGRERRPAAAIGAQPPLFSQRRAASSLSAFAAAAADSGGGLGGRARLSSLHKELHFRESNFLFNDFLFGWRGVVRRASTWGKTRTCQFCTEGGELNSRLVYVRRMSLI